MAGINRRQVIANERTDFDDFNAVGNLCVGNLALALAAFRDPRVPNPGVARGLELIANGTMSPTLKVGAAFVPGNSIVVPGLAILETDTAIPVLAANNDGSHYARIDLVSLTYGETDGAPEQKIMVDPTTGATSQQSVNTQKAGTPTIAVVTGTAAATPAAPATPAGALALYQVQIDYGVTAITQAKITPVAASWPPATYFRVKHRLSSPTTSNAPWTSAESLVFTIPAGRYALLLGYAYFQVGGAAISAASALTAVQGATVSIVGATAGFVSSVEASCFAAPFSGACYAAPITPVAMAIVAGNGVADTYQLNIDVSGWNFESGAGWLAWTAMNVYEYGLTAILL